MFIFPKLQCPVSPTSFFSPIKNTIQPILTTIQEHVLFFGLFCKHHKTVGSIAPSSKALARVITRYIPDKSNSNPPQSYLEIGPGTGSFTRMIVEKLRLEDELHLVEITPEFVKILRKKYAHKKNVTVHDPCSILAWKESKQFDRVVSGLPLNSFSPEFVQQYLTKVVALTKQNGIISDFRYPKLPSKKIKMLTWTDKCFKRSDRQEFEKVLSATSEFYMKYGFKKVLVKQKSGDAEVRFFKMPNSKQG